MQLQQCRNITNISININVVNEKIIRNCHSLTCNQKINFNSPNPLDQHWSILKLVLVIVRAVDYKEIDMVSCKNKYSRPYLLNNKYLTVLCNYF